MSIDTALARQRRSSRPGQTIGMDESMIITPEPMTYASRSPASPTSSTLPSSPASPASPGRRQPPPVPAKPSSLVTRAESLSKRTIDLRDRVSTYIDGQTTTFSANNTRTEKPIVVSQATMDRVQAVGRGATVASNASKKFFGFVAKKVESMGDSAMQSQSLSQQNKQRLGDASKAFQIVAESLEESVAHVTKKATGHVDLVVRTKYGDQAADTSGHAVSAATKAVGVVLDVRGAPGLLVKSVGKGAVRAHLKDGTEVVLPEGVDQNEHLVRTEKDLIVLDDDVVEVEVEKKAGEETKASPRPSGVASRWPPRPQESDDTEKPTTDGQQGLIGKA